MRNTVTKYIPVHWSQTDPILALFTHIVHITFFKTFGFEYTFIKIYINISTIQDMTFDQRSPGFRSDVRGSSTHFSLPQTLVHLSPPCKHHYTGNEGKGLLGIVFLSYSVREEKDKLRFLSRETQKIEHIFQGKKVSFHYRINHPPNTKHKNASTGRHWFKGVTKSDISTRRV